MLPYGTNQSVAEELLVKRLTGADRSLPVAQASAIATVALAHAVLAVADEIRELREHLPQGKGTENERAAEG